MQTGVNYENLDERLDKVEVALNQTQRTLARVVALMDGDPSYRIVGMPDQLAAYIKANEDWKIATERRIIGLEKSGNTIVITRATAALLTAIGIIALVAAFLLLTWLQRAG